MNEKNYLTLKNLGEIQLHGFSKLADTTYAVITAGGSLVFETHPLLMQKSGTELQIRSDTRIIYDRHLYDFLFMHKKLLNKRFIYNNISSSYYVTDIEV